ncbi:MAG: Asp23/Gls24 family envelope stress response protein [Clostridiales bacterium]|nr:Asp23/Gls24 family envelope stress response protein [Clostridiales bacterium]MDR2751281.1 Asp23/Gls24 family envelope stress response protein [Clostridiales bacterium]
MSLSIKNAFGTITIDNEVVARIAGMAAIDCYGIVGMAAKNVKDGLVQLLKMESLTKGIRLKVTECSVAIDLHIIVEYGTNIAAIADSIISTVKYRVEENIGMPVEDVNIFVEGVRIE